MMLLCFCGGRDKKQNGKGGSDLYIGTRTAMAMEAGGRDGEGRGRPMGDYSAIAVIVKDKRKMRWGRFCACGAVLLFACTVWVASEGNGSSNVGFQGDALLGTVEGDSLRNRAKIVAKKLYEAELDLAKVWILWERGWKQQFRLSLYQDGFRSQQKLANLRALQKTAVHLAAELRAQRDSVSAFSTNTLCSVYFAHYVVQGDFKLGRKQMLASTSLMGLSSHPTVPVKEILRLQDLGSLVKEIQKSGQQGTGAAQANPININIYLPQYPGSPPAGSAAVSQEPAAEDELQKQNKQIQGILASMQHKASNTAVLHQAQVQREIKNAVQAESQDLGVANPLKSSELRRQRFRKPAGTAKAARDDALIRKMKMDGMILEPGRVQSLSSVPTKHQVVSPHAKLADSASSLSLSARPATSTQKGTNDERLLSLAMSPLSSTPTVSLSELRRSARDEYRSLLHAAGDAEKMKITGSLGDLLPNSIMNAENRRNVIFEMNNPYVRAKVSDK